MSAKQHPLFDEWNKALENYRLALATWDNLKMHRASRVEVEAAERKLEQTLAAYENVSSQI